MGPLRMRSRVLAESIWEPKYTPVRGKGTWDRVGVRRISMDWRVVLSTFGLLFRAEL
jgi:hypothetical protein